jgi:Ran GTPase-activating protein (RanGAP) involved in mRNA processing and transport
MGVSVHFANELRMILMNPLNDRIAHVDLHKNDLGDAGVKTLMKAIKLSKTVVHLNVASNEISNEGMSAIFKSLQKNESLVSLNISTIEGIARNRVSHKSIQELKNLLKCTKILSILDASSVGLGNEGMIAICEVLADDTIDCPL